MRKVIVTTDQPEVARKLQGTYAKHTHYDREHRFSDDVEVVTGEGRLIGRLFSGKLSDSALDRAYEIIHAIKTPLTRRGRVVGKGAMMPRLNKDGTVSNMIEIPKRVQKLVGCADTIGWLGVSKEYPHGRISSYTKSHPKARPALTPVLREIDKLFYEEYPAAHAWQAEGYGDNVANWYGNFGHDTAFGSCYGNNEVRSAYHRDAANLGGSLSALFTMGDYEGGGLVLPRFRVAFDVYPGDLLLFHGDDIHGVLPYKGHRCSGVFFSAAHWGDFWEDVELPVDVSLEQLINQAPKSPT
jgi:hypothetical protein